MGKDKHLWHGLSLHFNTVRFLCVLLAFSIIGGVIVMLSHAAVTNNSFEAESGARSGRVTTGTDNNASANSFVTFHAPVSTCPLGQIGIPPNCITPPLSTTLPPKSVLPDDATCSARVIKTGEVRPQNAITNATAGHQKNLSGLNSRIDGNYTGTTDEILQWTACKWGINLNIVYAQAAKESWWVMKTYGDYGTDVSACPPAHGLGVDGRAGQCPQSYGLLQVRWPYHGPPAGLDTWPEAETSTAYNADYTYAQWRKCFEGELTWLGGTYAAGDAWGCVGTWFSGRWHTPEAESYIQAVKDYMNQKIWTTPSFVNTR